MTTYSEMIEWRYHITPKFDWEIYNGMTQEVFLRGHSCREMVTSHHSLESILKAICETMNSHNIVIELGTGKAKEMK